MLMVPPITRASFSLLTGMDSPVTMDSSTEERPSSTMPSTGTLSPGEWLGRGDGYFMIH
jgi:hypothetical protein